MRCRAYWGRGPGLGGARMCSDARFSAMALMRRHRAGLVGLVDGCGATVGRERRGRLGRLVGPVGRRPSGAGVGLVVLAVLEARWVALGVMVGGCSGWVGLVVSVGSVVVLVGSAVTAGWCGVVVVPVESAALVGVRVGLVGMPHGCLEPVGLVGLAGRVWMR